MLDIKDQWNPCSSMNEVDAFFTEIVQMAPRYNSDGDGILFKASGSYFHKEKGSLSCDDEGHFLKFVNNREFNEEMWAFRFIKYKNASARTRLIPSDIYGRILAAAPRIYLEAKIVCQMICKGGKACKVCGLKRILDAFELISHQIEG